VESVAGLLWNQWQVWRGIYAARDEEMARLERFTAQTVEH